MEIIDPDIQLSRNTWLTRAIRTYTQRAKPPSPPSAPLEPRAFDAWIQSRLRSVTLIHEEPGQQTRGLGRHVFLTTLEKQVQLIGEAGVMLGHPAERHLAALEAAIVFGMGANLLRDAEKLSDIWDDLAAGETIPEDKLSRAIRGPMANIGKALARGRLDDGHPLLGRAFHRLLIHSETLLLLQQAELFYRRGRVAETEALTLFSRAQLQKLYAIEAIIALSWADGVIDPMEQRLIKTLIQLGHFSRQEQRMLHRRLKGDPPTAEELAREVIDPSQRKLLLEQVILTGLIDGEIAPAEERFIERLADAFGIDSSGLLEQQLQLLNDMDALTEVTRGLSWGGVLGRARRQTQSRAERLVKDNLTALVTEARETGDLVQLLAASTRRSLTAEESERVKTQLLDICKTIPSLAIVAAPIPGISAIVLPLMIKLLPFSILPTAFTEDDESLLIPTPEET